MCRIYFFVTLKGDNSHISLIKRGSQIMPFIMELSNLNLSFEKDYEMENLAYEIIRKIWGKETGEVYNSKYIQNVKKIGLTRIEMIYKFCNIEMVFNGNNKLQDKKTIVILKIALPVGYFEEFNSENNLTQFEISSIEKAMENGKMGNDESNVRIDETHRSILRKYLRFNSVVTQ